VRNQSRRDEDEGERETGRTGDDGHDEEHVDALAELVRDGARRRVGRDGDGGAHAGRVDELDELVSRFCGRAGRQRERGRKEGRRRDGPGCESASMWNVYDLPPASATGLTHCTHR